eukprot:6211456-Pleurochrysis_carterae.AAC.3
MEAAATHYLRASSLTKQYREPCVKTHSNQAGHQGGFPSSLPQTYKHAGRPRLVILPTTLEKQICSRPSMICHRS